MNFQHRLPLLAAFSFAVSALVAQTNNGSIRGTVTDESKALLPGVSIQLRSTATGLSRSVQTNEAGVYEFAVLPPGNYSVEASREGFQGARVEAELRAGDLVRVDIGLRVSGTTESITVSESTGAVQSESATLSAGIAPDRIQSLPLLGRNFNSLISIQPGVTTVTYSTGLSFAVNGGPSGTGFNITLDGTDATAVSTQRVAVARNQFQQTNTTSLEAVQEIRVYTNNYSADIGRASSGAVNVVTKSGTNDLHFGLFEYFRNTVLNANSVTANSTGLPRAPIRLNQFGANVGGRISKDRTFYWLGWENSNQSRGRTSTYTVLSDAGRAAIQDRAVRQYVEEWVPAANQPALATNPLIANLIRNESVAVRESIGTARIDHQINTKNNIFFRYNILDAVAEIPGLYAPKEVAQSNSRQQLFTISDTHIFTPGLVNELRVGANRFITPQVGAGPLPSIQVVGGILAARGTTENYLNTAYNVVNTVFQQRGRHSLRYGIEYREVFAGRKADGNAGFTYSTVNDLLVNRPQQLNIFQRYGGTTGTGGNLSAFFQDDYKVTPRLTLNLGLRYDYFFVPGERTGRAYNIISGIPPIADLRFNGTGERMMKPDRNNFGPRFGFAYSLNPKTSIRGGYGIFFSPQQASAGVPAAANASPPVIREEQADTAYIQPAVSYTRADGNLVYPVTEYGTKFPPLAPIVYDPNYREGYSQQWNLTVEREVITDTVFSTAYVASKNTKVQSAMFLNLPRPLFGNTREDPRFTNINYIGPFSSGNYHALQTAFRRRLRRGITVDANYTWSHTIDDFTAFFGLNGGSAPSQDQQNRRNERGEGEFDVRHSFKSSFYYELPFRSSNRTLHQVVSNWQASGVVIAQTGTPYSILTGRSAGDGMNNQRANAVADVSFFSGSARALNAQVLNRAAFAVPTDRDPATGLVIGNLSKSALSGPPTVTWNLSAHRTFPLTEKANLQFRAEMFNAFNQVNFARPVNTMSNPNFGRILGAGAPREIQLALKLTY